MKEEKISVTALGVAVARAYDNKSRFPILGDSYAQMLLYSPWDTIVKNRFLRRLVIGRFFNRLFPGIVGLTCARSRYVEERLRRKASVGPIQYVILGAGLDSFLLRQGELTDRIKIFEIDLPATQNFKLRKLRDMNLTVPDNAFFISSDFIKDDIAETLAACPDYSKDEPGLFGFLGMTPYLKKELIFKIIKTLGAFCPAGSEFIFDYVEEGMVTGKSRYRGAERLKKSTARRGEPMITGFNPDVLPSELKDAGLELIENVSPCEQNRRYFTESDIEHSEYNYICALKLK